MKLSRRGLLGTAAALLHRPADPAPARKSKPVIKLGVLTDLSGTYRDNTGPTSVAAAPGDRGDEAASTASTSS